MQRTASIGGNRQRAGSIGRRAGKESYGNLNVEQQLVAICDIVEKNRSRDFTQMTSELGKRRIAKLLITPVERADRSLSALAKKLRKSEETEPATEERPGGTEADDNDDETEVDVTVENIEQPPDLWWTPLHLMAKYGRVDMVTAVGESIEQLLIERGGAETWSDVFGQTPLHLACTKGNVPLCRMLCRHASAVMSCTVKPGTQGNSAAMNLLNMPDRLGCTPLHYAVLQKNRCQAEELAKILLSSGCDPNIPDIDGFSPLAICANRGNIEMASLLMAFGANPNFRNPDDGWTPLMLAILKGNAKLVIGMLNPHQLPSMAENVPSKMAPIPANPSVQTNSGASALIVAAQCGHADVMADMFASSRLVAQTINLQDSAGRTALATAAFKGHAKVISVLLEKKANPNLADKDGVTPLMIAAYKGLHPVADLLVHAGADLTLKDKNGCSALMIASQLSNVDLTKLLLTSFAGADLPLSRTVNAQQEDGTTALMLASAKGNERNIEMLIAAGATLEPTREIDEWTAIFHGVYAEKAKPMKSLLAKPPTPVPTATGIASPATVLNRVGSEINRNTNPTKLTPLILACLLGNTQMARVLLDNGANPNLCDGTAFAPIMAAAQTGEEKLVPLLLGKGAESDVQDNVGYSPLMIAAINGFAKICEILLAHGASPDLQQFNGRTALMFAVEKGFSDIVKLFLRQNCDLTISDFVKRTALHYAIMGADEKVVAALCEVEALDPNPQDREGITPLMIAASSFPPAKPPPPQQPGDSEDGQLTADEEPETPEDQQPEVIEVKVSKKEKKMKSGKKEKNPTEPAPAEEPVIGPPPDILYVMPLMKRKTINLDLQDMNGETALIKAYRNQNWPMAEALLKAGASASIVADDGASPIVIAAMNGYLHGIKLIKHYAGGTINLTDNYGRSALFHAVEQDRSDAVNLLLRKPAPCDPNVAPSRSKCPFPDDPNSDEGKLVSSIIGVSPLHIAAKRGDRRTVGKLLDHGANVNQQNDRRETPLMMACTQRAWDVVAYLLSKNAAVTTRDHAGQTVFHRLCYFGNVAEQLKGLKLLVKYRGPSILDNVIDSPAHNTVLHWAVVCDQPEMVEEILKCGASRDLQNSEGKTPVDMVVYGPALFEMLGNEIGPLWRDMAPHLRKTASFSYARQNSGLPEMSLFTDEEIEVIQALYAMEEANEFQKKCAATLIERFYEKNDDNTFLDTNAITYAWRKASHRIDLTQGLLDIFEQCEGKSLIFRSATLENLTKEYDEQQC